MKTQVLFLGFVSGLSYSIAQTCNDGFESNSFAGWQGATGTNAGNYSITITGTTISSPRFSIEGVATGTIICSNSVSNPTVYQPLPANGFGQYSARIGEYNVVGGGVEMITYSFVPSVNDTNFLFAYSTYLQAPGHGPTDNPYFVIGILDANGDTIPGSFYMYQTGTFSTLGFDTSACGYGLHFKPWTIRGVNLSSYAGQVVTLFAVNADCSYGGHYAYSYIDIDCDGVLNVPATSNLVLNAKSEEGSTYLWNTGSTTPTIIVASPSPNSIYTCKVTLPANYNNQTFYVSYQIIGTTNIESTPKTITSFIYPNPANDKLYLNSIKSFKLINALGQIVKSLEISENTEVVDITDLPEGIYFTQSIDINNNSYFDKLLIKRK